MKNIMVFTYGDANNPSTWSNVPYLFTTTLKNKGYNVISVDISTRQNIFTLFFSLVCKLIKPSTTFYFYRSKINRRIVERKIKKAVTNNDNMVDLYISISFDFSPAKYTNKKVLLISDWPIEYALEKRYKRKPDFMERRDIERHKSVIENSTYCISLFQDVASYMNVRFDKETIYLGGLINSLYSIDGFEDTNNRCYITFIGKKAYYDSAKEVVAAFENLSRELIDKRKLELHIIGMDKNDFKNVSNDKIFFHGYLNKGKKDEYETYYNVLKKSIVLVNTNELWAGMSSVLEAMYYYRPIITSKYEEFVQTFGEDIDFGYYSANNHIDIKSQLETIIQLNENEYKEMSISAHLAVKDFTYDAFIDKIGNCETN